MTYYPPAYILGLDLGKKRDWTALAVVNQIGFPTGQSYRTWVGYGPGWEAVYDTVDELEYRYDLVHLDRWQGKDYRDAIPVVESVVQRLHQVAYQEFFEARGYTRAGEGEPMISLVVDQTGVGEAVIESLRGAGLSCQGIIIHGGDAVNKMDGGYRVPKRELVGVVEVLLQNRRLRIPKALPMSSVLVQELQAFKATIKLTTGHTTYAADESWRENPHDDTVLAVALAAWYGEHVNPAGQWGQNAAVLQAWANELT
jgi:hypothetical protein